MHKYNEHITIVSETFPQDKIEEILATPRTFFPECHVLYPSDEGGSHLLRFFSIEEIVKNERYIDWILEDIDRWVGSEEVGYDIVFVPNQPSVVAIAEELTLVWLFPPPFWPDTVASWEYKGTGRFGDRLVRGAVKQGDRVLVFNGVTQQGRCVGQRLPSFVESLGGEVVAAAVFAKGNTGLVKECELKYGPKFYSAIQVDIPVFAEHECPVCLVGGQASLRPWTDLLKA